LRLPRALRSKARQLILDAITTAYDQRLGFPWTQPQRDDHSAKSTLFQKTVSDADLLQAYERNPLAHVIVNDVAEDVFSRGFRIELIQNQPDILPSSSLRSQQPGNSSGNVVQAIIASTLQPQTTAQQGATPTPSEFKIRQEQIDKKFQEYFTRLIRSPLIKAYKLARLYGWSALLLGFDDQLPFDQKARTGAQIRWLQPIDKTWVEETIYEEDKDGRVIFPVRIKAYRLRQEQSQISMIHSSRVLRVVNPGIDMLGEGESALLASYDDLTVLKHVTWGAGQTMWRSGNQLVTAIAPPRATQSQIDAIDSALEDVNARSAMTFPHGTTIETHPPSGLNPEQYAKIPIQNISAATRIPISILIGSQPGALSSSLTDMRDYASTLSSIQNNVISPVLHQIFEKLQLGGQLPMVRFKIVWENTLTVSPPEDAKASYLRALTERIKVELLEKELKLKEKLKTTEPKTKEPGGEPAGGPTNNRPPVTTELTRKETSGPTLDTPPLLWRAP